MYCRGHVLILFLLLAATCKRSVAPPTDQVLLFLGPITFTSSVSQAGSERILTEAFDSVSNLHASFAGRSRISAYIPVQLTDDVLLHMQSRGDLHFSGGRAQLYQLPYATDLHGQVWLSLIKDSSGWVQLTQSQREPSSLALIWQAIDGSFSLRGAFGLSRTYANTVRNRLPAWKPIRHPVGGVHGFRYMRASNAPPGPFDRPQV